MTEADCSACAQCGKPFERPGKKGRPPKFCSTRCKKRDYNNTGPKEGKCSHCGNSFEKTGERGQKRKYCSQRCVKAVKNRYQKAYAPKSIREFKCAHCEVAFHTAHKRSFCSPLCRVKAQDKMDGVKPFAEMVADRRQRSKFNFNCEHCGKAFYRLPGGHNIKNGSRARWCSMRCKKDATVSRQEENRVPAFSKYFARFCAECEKPFSALAERVLVCKECKRRRTLVIRAPCEQCGGPIIGRGKKFCSTKCHRLSPSYKERKAAGRKAGKLKRRGAVVTNFNPIVVLERDGWRCQICGVSTPKSRRGTNHHNAPELDHIQPLSKNGEHSIENTQCACRACNGLKSNVLVIGQIGLFSADAIAKAGVRNRGVKKWEKVASA